MTFWPCHKAIQGKNGKKSKKAIVYYNIDWKSRKIYVNHNIDMINQHIDTTYPSTSTHIIRLIIYA